MTVMTIARKNKPQATEQRENVMLPFLISSSVIVVAGSSSALSLIAADTSEKRKKNPIIEIKSQPQLHIQLFNNSVLFSKTIKVTPKTIVF